MTDPGEKLQSYFAGIAQDLPGSGSTTWRRLSSITEAAGYRRNNDRLRAAMAAEAAAAQLYTDIPLDDPTLAPSSTIRFQREPFDECSGLAPGAEKAMIPFFAASCGARGTPLERWYDPKIETRAPGGSGRIDMLCKERGRNGSFGGFVVVEFEHTSPAGTVGQVVEYIDAVRAAHPNTPVRGVIVSTADYERELGHLPRYPDYDITWLTARLTLQTIATSP